jgi:hypothetical protein
MRYIPLFLLVLIPVLPSSALAEVPERTFWAETSDGQTLLDVTALSEGERASVEQMADKYPDEGKGAPRIPADEPLLLPRFRVGERYAVITAKGTYGLGIVGFAATRGASEAHLLVYLEKLPKGAGKEGLAVPEAWLPQDFRPKLTPLKAVPLPKPIAAKLLDKALAGLSAEEKTGLGRRKPATSDLKAYTARMPSGVRWIVTCAKKLSLTEVFSGMVYVSATGETVATHAPFGVGIEHHLPRYAIDLDRDGLDEILFDSVYYEGDYRLLLKWEKGAPTVVTLTGDGA